jgi:erythromycin esterase
MFPGAPGAVLTTLQYLAKVSPATESRLGGRLRPLMDRFMPTRYAAYSPADRDLLRVTLDSVYQRLATDSSRYARATSPRAFAYGLRSAWMAIRVNDLMARGVAAPDGMIRAALTLRDSTMAENTQWALDQEGPHGRVVVFAHNGHVLNTTAEFDSVVVKLLGYRLRARFDTNVVILGSTAGTIVGGAAVDVGGWVRGSGESKADSTTFTALLAKVGLPTFVLVGRSADRLPDVAAALEKTWPFVIVGVQSVVPRRTFDAIVYFDRVSPAKLRE